MSDEPVIGLAGIGALLEQMSRMRGVVDAAALQRQLAARIVASRLMCDPEYVLDAAGRERLLRALADTGSDPSPE